MPLPKPKLPPKPKILGKKSADDSKTIDSEPSQVSSAAGSTKAANDKVEHAPVAVKDEKRVFYINITVHDASAVIREKVTQKMSEKQAALPGPQKFKDRVAKSVANSAAKRVPPSKIAEKMAQKMPKMLPMKMKQKGLTVAVEEVFREENYFVLQVQVRHVDMGKMVEESQKSKENGDGVEEDDDDSVSSEELSAYYEKQKEEEARLEQLVPSETPQYRDGLAGFVEWFLALLGMRMRNHIEGEYLPAMIQKQMSSTMGEMLQKKYASKNIKADAETLPEEKQAKYFYANLKKIRNSGKKVVANEF